MFSGFGVRLWEEIRMMKMMVVKGLFYGVKVLDMIFVFLGFYVM